MNCVSANKLPNAKFAVLYLQNCDLFFQENSKTKHCTKKCPKNQNILFSAFYISLPNFRALVPIVIFVLF